MKKVYLYNSFHNTECTTKFSRDKIEWMWYIASGCASSRYEDNIPKYKSWLRSIHTKLCGAKSSGCACVSFEIFDKSHF